MRVSPTARPGPGKQQQQPAEPTVISQRMLCFRRGFGLGANCTSPLLPQQGFVRVREEEVQDSRSLLGFAFPGSRFVPRVHPARPN